MKTETAVPSVDIWNNNDVLLGDELISDIGNCPTILPNLDAATVSNEPPIPEIKTVGKANHVQKNYMVLKDNGGDKSETTKKSPSFKNGINFDEMLYFVCNLCPFLCTNKSKIHEHLENAHKTKIARKLPSLKCPACPNVFFHKMSLRSHLIHDHGVGNSDINLVIQTVVYQANKAKSGDGKKAAPPKIDSSLVVENSDTSSSEQSISVPLPKIEMPAIKTEDKLEQGFKPVSGDKLHSCVIPMCKVMLQDADNMNYHIRCHKDTGFACLVCSEFFTTWKQLASHLWHIHKIDMELYTCDKCTYKCVSLAKLNNIHKLIHSDIKAYVCTICKKAFKNSKQLGNHKITHKNKDEYERLKLSCEVCCKSFSDKRQLRVHISVVHEKNKPFLCNYCGYKGSSRSSLKMHIRQHTGEKPFTCDLCTYATSDHNSFRRHKLRHTGQKPYKCSYCSYACIQSSTYKVHLKTKHPGQEKDLLFTCQECQFRSVNKEIYLVHMATVHAQKPQS